MSEQSLSPPPHYPQQMNIKVSCHTFTDSEKSCMLGCNMAWLDHTGLGMTLNSIRFKANGVMSTAASEVPDQADGTSEPR